MSVSMLAQIADSPLHCLRYLRASSVRRAILRQAELSRQLTTEAEIQSWQLKQLNLCWSQTAAHTPHYRTLVDRGDLPRQFDSFAHFHTSVPVTTRSELIQELPTRCASTQSGAPLWRATGGSTAEPFRFPCWASEIAHCGDAVWFARSWLGISPEDRLFLLWGHSHLLGTGWRGIARRCDRIIKDRALGYRRWSAYDLSRVQLRRAADSLLHFRPRYIVGYSRALERFAAHNADRSDSLRALRLKAVIATAESFPAHSTRERLAEVFGCPVLMEYGAAETGVLAQEYDQDRYRVLWQHYILESRPSPHATGHAELLVTSLHPRCLPLVRYQIGDHIDTDSAAGQSVLELRHVLGRCNDTVHLRSGRILHSEAIAHVVRDFPEIRGYQLSHLTSGALELRLRTTKELTSELIAQLHFRFERLDITLADISFRRVEYFEHSRAGKVPTVVHQR